MLARLLRTVMAVLVGGAVAWFVACWQLGRPGLGAIGAVLLLFGHGVVLALEFALLLGVRRGDPAPPASAWELLRAWAGECVWSTRVFCWQQPFCAQRWPDLLVPRGRRGIVFIHGYFCNRGFWNPWLARCHAEGRPFVAVNLEPVFGEIDDYVPQVEAAIATLEAATGVRPLVVAHSMGGLALRAWRCATPGSDRRVHGFVTLGTPHHGTWMARWSRARNARAMRRGSLWLGGLATREAQTDAAGPATRRTCYWSHADNIVMPPSTAIWPGAEAHHLRATAHVAMAFQPTVFAAVSAWADEPVDAAGSAAGEVSAPTFASPG